MKTLPITLLAAALLPAARPARAADAPQNWTADCASCHGKDGAGHTRAGRMLGAKDLTSAGYQKSFTDDQAFKAVKEGLKNDAGVQKMKPFADKLSDQDIKGLVAYVRTLQK